MRRGFTMIELIFVIVIIGILAAVAIPKLAATRDDATIAKMLQNASTCISDAGAQYTSKGKPLQASDLSTNIPSCAAATNDGAFTFTLDSTGAQLTVAAKSGATGAAKAANGSQAGTNMIKTYNFGGNNVSF